MYTIYKCWFCGRDIKYIHPQLEPEDFFADDYTLRWSAYFGHEEPQKMLWDCDTLMVALGAELEENFQRAIARNMAQLTVSLSDIRTKY